MYPNAEISEEQKLCEVRAYYSQREKYWMTVSFLILHVRATETRLGVKRGKLRHVEGKLWS